MGIPYGARVSERWFLNNPGFLGGAYVLAFLEDTSGQHPRPEEWCSEDCRECDTLIAALRVFRTGLVEEFDEYDRRERELAELKGE
jgi:hypothetical protein